MRDWGGIYRNIVNLICNMDKKKIKKFRLLIMGVFTYFPFRRGEYVFEIGMLYVFVCFVSIYNYFKYF